MFARHRDAEGPRVDRDGERRLEAAVDHRGPEASGAQPARRPLALLVANRDFEGARRGVGGGCGFDGRHVAFAFVQRGRSAGFFRAGLGHSARPVE